jgi:hypothetical protein
MEAKMFNAAQANKRVREHHAKLTEQSAKLAHAQLAADKEKYKGVHVPPGTHKRPSQELMDQIQKRNESKKKHDKNEREKAFARSVQRLKDVKDVKGGRRTRRHKKRSNKKRTNSRRSRRPNMRRIS